jgi:hypothetical protein
MPAWQTLALFAYAMVSCLVVNDAVKVAMIRRHDSGMGSAGPAMPAALAEGSK